MRVLGKEKCAKTADRLRSSFGLYPKPLHDEPRLQDICDRYLKRQIDEAALGCELKKYYTEYPDPPEMLSFFLLEAVTPLIENQRKKDIEESAVGFQKTKKLSSVIKKIIDDVQDENIQNFMKLKADYLDDSFDKYLSVLSDLRKAHEKLKIPITLKLKAGRPSLGVFNNYVVLVAKLYEELGDEKFTVLRHRKSVASGSIEYVAITPGHQFVEIAVDWLNKQLSAVVDQYDSKNILHACEEAVTTLKNRHPDK